MADRTPRTRALKQDDSETEGTEVVSEEESLAMPDEEGVEEFNIHIQDLVRLFFQQQVQELEKRISDLEMVIGHVGPQHTLGPSAADRPMNKVPEYLPTQQSDSNIPWF